MRRGDWGCQGRQRTKNRAQDTSLRPCSNRTAVSLRSLGIRAPSIALLLALQTEEVKQIKVDKGDQPQKQHPTALAQIVKTTNANGQCGNRYGKPVNRPDKRKLYQRTDNGQHNHYNQVEQHEHPIFPAACTAFEVSIMFFYNFQIPIHTSLFFKLMDKFHVLCPRPYRSKSQRGRAGSQAASSGVT